jgi:hypothetical protein
VQWPVTRLLLVALAGTVPFLSFVMERRTVAWIQGNDRQPSFTEA